jgi:hypothetical protein
MAIGPFANVFNYLDSLGVLDVLLPFAIIFTVVWAVLNRIKIFGNETGSKINTILAISIAVLSIVPHVTGKYQQFDIVNFINTSFPQVGLIVMSIVLLLILLGTLGTNVEEGYKNIAIGTAGLIALVVLGIVIWNSLFPYSTPTWLNFLGDPDLQALLVIILVFGLIVYFVTKGEKKTGDKEWHDQYRGFLENVFGKHRDYVPPKKP